LLFLIALKAAAAQKLDSIPCVGWETTANAFETAKADWNDPDCYSFDFVFLGYTVGVPLTVTRQVLNGAALNAKEGERIQTMDDVWNLIEAQCVANCPTSGAHQCTTKYTTTTAGTYPSYLSIDISEFVKDEEPIYRIENFIELTDCAETNPPIVPTDTASAFPSATPGSTSDAPSTVPSDAPSAVPSDAPSTK
jgi:hypothetical protein